MPAAAASPIPPAVANDPRWAWAAYVPDRDRPWNLQLAAHLHRRAAFAADWPQLQRTLREGPRAAVDRLLNPPADQIAAFDGRMDQLEDGSAGSIPTLAAWWLRRIITTPAPLRENMTLFWHNRFAARASLVKDGRAMLEYVRTLRRHAIGHCEPMLAEALRGPAVLCSFDAEANRKAQPNHHLATRLLEHLGPGAGGFTQTDVRAAARAMTGWFVYRGRSRFIDREHDTDAKTLFGQTGPWREVDVVRLMFARRATADHLARDLYRWFISDIEPADTLIAPLAERLAAGYRIGPVVELMLRSNLFFSEAAYRRRIKSPVELAAGLARAVGAIVPTEPLARHLSMLGQDVYDPPTAAGWPHGRRWINTMTLTGRANLAAALLDGDDKGPYAGRLDPAEAARSAGARSVPDAARFVIELLVQNDLPDDVRKNLIARAGDSPRVEPTRLRELTCAVACLPEFQLA